MKGLVITVKYGDKQREASVVPASGAIVKQFLEAAIPLLVKELL